MNQEDKELLLKDLCARLPYGVIVSVTDGTIKYEAYIESVSYKYIQVSPVSGSVFTPYTFYKISEIKPYLRPMDSMTEEEEEEYHKTMAWSGDILNEKIGIWVPTINSSDYLIAHHFDYRGLIPKGLAIAVTEENNPYKE